MNNNTAQKLRAVPDSDPPLPRVSSAVAGFIVCTLAGAFFGFVVGLLTGHYLWPL
jgi:hypothetical protein